MKPAYREILLLVCAQSIRGLPARRLIMPAACLLLAIAVTGGTMLTFLFDQGAPRAARICMGACLGLPLLTGIGFVCALWMGLNAASIAISAATMFLPFLLLVNATYRSRVLAQFWPGPRTVSRKAASPKGSSTAGYMLLDRKSTRLNSSHANISYAVFCLKKKN